MRMKLDARRGDQGAVHLVTSARGVLFARRWLLGDDLELTGWVVRAVVVAIRANASLDELTVRTTPYEIRSDDAKKIPTLEFPERDYRAKLLYERAMREFDRSCRPLPARLEEWRRYFLSQMDKEYSDEGLAFEERISDLPWRDALTLVREPWQLAMVLDQHADERFDNGARPLTHERRALSMIRGSNLPSFRKAELERMIWEYVAPADDDWAAPIEPEPSNGSRGAAGPRTPHSPGTSRPQAV
jgi:hypothetical protein